MPSRTRVCAWLALGGLVVPSLAIAQDRTERDVIDLIVRQGPDAQTIHLEADVVRREQFARLVFPNPGVIYSREGAGFTEFLQVEQPLLPFGARAALTRAGAARTAVAEAERDARLWALRGDAAAAVVALVAAQDRLDLAETHTRDVERLAGILRTREREGEGSRFDRIRAEHELRESRLAAMEATVGLAAARATVAAMMPPGLTVGRITSAAAARPAPGSIEVLLLRAGAARAELRGLRDRAEHAAREATAARRSRLPAPAVFGGLKRSDDGSTRHRGGVFGVSVSVPLFDGGGRDAARWNAEQVRVESERVSTERRIRAEVTRAREAVTLWHAALAEDTGSLGDDLAEIAEVGYREGEVGILELLDALRTAFRARVRGIELRRDSRLAEIALERAVGETLWP
jgi:cobalt-zinc-cadmium efflux system outer membrane protein